MKLTLNDKAMKAFFEIFGDEFKIEISHAVLSGFARKYVKTSLDSYTKQFVEKVVNETIQNIIKEEFGEITSCFPRKVNFSEKFMREYKPIIEIKVKEAINSELKVLNINQIIQSVVKEKISEIEMLTRKKVYSEIQNYSANK